MDPFWALVTYIVLLFSLCVHEFAHAWVAYLCGDDTARLQGRMTLNPFAHMDLLGTLIIPLFQLMSPYGRYMFGWAKPVPVNPNNFGQYRRDDMLVSLAGIAANLVMALCAVVALRIAGLFAREAGVGVAPEIFKVLYRFMSINVVLAVFNLIPVPPLDGFQFGKHFLPMQMRWNVQKIYQYGPFILLALLWTGMLRYVVYPPLILFTWLAGLK